MAKAGNSNTMLTPDRIEYVGVNEVLVTLKTASGAPVTYTLSTAALLEFVNLSTRTINNFSAQVLRDLGVLSIAVAVLLLAFSPPARAGTCQDEMAKYEKQVAEDKAASMAPAVREQNDKINQRVKANILKGCAKGGFYEQLDEAIRAAEAECKAHPNRTGC